MRECSAGAEPENVREDVKRSRARCDGSTSHYRFPRAVGMSGSGSGKSAGGPNLILIDAGGPLSRGQGDNCHHP